MPLGRRMVLPVAMVACCWAAGCSAEVDYLSSARLDRGMVFFLDGVGGYNIGPQWVREGLDEGGVESANYIFPWGHGPAGMFVADLFDESGNRKRAAELARLVESYQRFYPGRPVCLIGHSGGAGMVVFALEEMTPAAKVDVVFLLAPALDPGRNLAPALRHVRRYCFATSSSADFPLMGTGTSIFGTMDRKHTVSAGLVGFHLPDDLSPDDRMAYRKLRQARWDATLLARGHLGGHMGWSSTAFAREFLAPILRGEDPSPIFKPVAEDADDSQDSSRAATSGEGGQS